VYWLYPQLGVNGQKRPESLRNGAGENDPAIRSAPRGVGNKPRQCLKDMQYSESDRRKHLHSGSWVYSEQDLAGSWGFQEPWPVPQRDRLDRGSTVSPGLWPEGPGRTWKNTDTRRQVLSPDAWPSGILRVCVTGGKGADFRLFGLVLRTQSTLSIPGGLVLGPPQTSESQDAHIPHVKWQSLCI
jgi:hypothetical protein